MAVYKSTVPRALGLNWRTESELRLIGPGDDFVANASDIPQSYLDLGWVVLVSANPEPVVVDEAPKGKLK